MSAFALHMGTYASKYEPHDADSDTCTVYVLGCTAPSVADTDDAQLNRHLWRAMTPRCAKLLTTLAARNYPLRAVPLPPLPRLSLRAAALQTYL